MRVFETLKDIVPSSVKTKIKKVMSSLRGSTTKNEDREIKFMNIDDYEEWYYNRPQAKAYLNNEKIWLRLGDMIQYFKPKRVFEFGSGLGNLLKECQNRGVDIIGSETSEYAIKNSLCKDKTIKIG